MKVYLMDLKQVSVAIGFKKTTIYKWIHEGAFPKPVKIGRHVRWASNEIEEWINARVTDRDRAG